MRTVSPRTRRGGQLLGGRGWSSAAWLVRPELCHARVFLDSASWRGMTRVPPRLRCALCHPALDAGSRESRREIYSRSLLQELLDSASQRGMTRVPLRLRCALCHPALDAGSRESRREIYSRSLLQELLDSVSQRGMTRVPPCPRCALCHPALDAGSSFWRWQWVE